jgi:hypothetical protein
VLDPTVICSFSGVTVSVGNGTSHIRYFDQNVLSHNETFEYDLIIDSLTAAGYTPDKNIIAFPVKDCQINNKSH